jgi:hypothetical protein
VDIIPVLPLSQGEIDGGREAFVARLLDGAGVDMASPAVPATRDEYAQRSTYRNALVQLPRQAAVGRVQVDFGGRHPSTAHGAGANEL